MAALYDEVYIIECFGLQKAINRLGWHRAKSLLFHLCYEI
jgi:hypothetical protein